MELALSLPFLRLLLSTPPSLLLSARISLVHSRHSSLKLVKVIVFVLILLHQMLQLLIGYAFIVRRTEVVDEVELFTFIELFDQLRFASLFFLAIQAIHLIRWNLASLKCLRLLLLESFQRLLS